MSFKVFIKGESFKGLAGQILEEELPRVLAVVDEATTLVYDDIKDRLGHDSAHSAPEGEAPRKVTGKLADAVKKVGARVRGFVVTGTIQINHPGANRLEFGSVDDRGIRTLPHPYVRPAFEATEQKVDTLLKALDT